MQREKVSCVIYSAPMSPAWVALGVVSADARAPLCLASFCNHDARRLVGCVVFFSLCASKDVD